MRLLRQPHDRNEAHWISRTDSIPFFAILAVTLFISYAYFYQAGGWNQNSRFDLVRAILERGTVRIDAYAQNTGDKATFDGHAYSDKAPGQALASVPAVAAGSAAHSGNWRRSHPRREPGVAGVRCHPLGLGGAHGDRGRRRSLVRPKTWRLAGWSARRGAGAGAWQSSLGVRHPAVGSRAGCWLPRGGVRWRTRAARVWQPRAETGG